MDYRSYLDNLKDIDKLEDAFGAGLLSEFKEDTPKDLHNNIMKMVRQDRELNENKNFRNYINNISSQKDINEELECGLLAELEEKAPVELHQNVMNLIKQDKKRNFFNYKKYMPVAVAASVLITVLSFSNNIINDRDASQNITENYISQGVQKEFEKIPENDSTIDEIKHPDLPAKDMALAGKAEQSAINGIDKSQADSKSKPVEKNTNKIIAPTDKGKVTEKSNSESVESKVNQENTQGVVALGEGKTVQKNETGSNGASSVVDSPREEPVMMYSLAFSGQAFGEKAAARSFNNGTEINYELQLNIDQIDIIDFVNSRGSIISYRIYSLSREDESILNVLLSNNNIEKKIINELTNNGNIIVKLSINGN